MWKLWNRLFGCEYVSIQFGFSYKVKRVKRTPLGRPYVTLYDNFFWLDRMINREWEALTFDKAVGPFQSRVPSPNSEENAG